MLIWPKILILKLFILGSVIYDIVCYNFHWNCNQLAPGKFVLNIHLILSKIDKDVQILAYLHR